jgi:hypothetical protein
MQHNGNAFLAFTEATVQFLDGLNVIDYYRRPLPAPADERLDAIVAQFMAAAPAQRNAFQETLTPSHRAPFGIYGHRAATRAVRQTARDLLLQGLVGAVLANYVIPPRRNVEVGLAVYHHCALKLELNPADLFTRAADYAPSDLAYRLVNFGSRADVTLSKFGWRELHTPAGVQYKFEWG